MVRRREVCFPLQAETTLKSKCQIPRIFLRIPRLCRRRRWRSRPAPQLPALRLCWCWAPWWGGWQGRGRRGGEHWGNEQGWEQPLLALLEEHPGDLAVEKRRWRWTRVGAGGARENQRPPVGGIEQQTNLHDVKIPPLAKIEDMMIVWASRCPKKLMCSTKSHYKVPSSSCTAPTLSWGPLPLRIVRVGRKGAS